MTPEQKHLLDGGTGWVWGVSLVKGTIYKSGEGLEREVP